MSNGAERHPGGLEDAAQETLTAVHLARVERGAGPFISAAFCYGWNPGLAPDQTKVCDRRVSLFWSAACVPLTPQLAAVPPEEVSHSSWSCAACRNPSPGHLEADCRAAVGQGAGSSFTSRGQRCPSTVGLTQARESCPFTPRVPSPLGASMLESEGPNHGCILLRCHGSAQHVQLAQQGLRFTTENWACLLGKMLEMMEKSIPSVAVSRITPCSLCHALAGSVSLQCFEEQRSGKGFPK
ncbi:hypothetical protein AV530_019467 [Patagioenas fasciata monilis]|uniref:Uncharacterized protein n=1 Tax=Patagioenas fasciata monilis TaxID=372326 RepID=A0A1V4JE02_PATFA|nr:hypothetical protein AV530_019467 [Patagioenas fasciata monilis]